jgi:hypothetical protein
MAKDSDKGISLRSRLHTTSRRGSALHGSGEVTVEAPHHEDGKEIPMPRLYQWFGITPHEWTKETLEIAQGLLSPCVGRRGLSLGALQNLDVPRAYGWLGWAGDSTTRKRCR